MGLAALNVLICAGQSLDNWKAVLNLDFNAFMESPNLAANTDKTSVSFSSVRVADFSKVKNLKAYVKDVEIAITSDDSGKVIFVSLPDKLTYEYETGFNKTLMDVQVFAASMDGEIGGAGVGCNVMSGMEIGVRNILFVIVLKLVFMLIKLCRH